ncbi:hypothetical protein [Psychrobacillus sp. MER TA 171]|uniref:hypothetical protein n=1 Tax=Psychrobacillus sp. MER TA 171 TaxID=2939577 RepID=UPI0020423A79|nr:hypothetical protein [Psychrobacillus sp. MER TA 171]MCM3357944.1 hypothetical protein [Psychrobacillus sp. MER TA 171]
MKNIKLSMMEAVLLESLRSNGVSNQELLNNLDGRSWEETFSTEYEALLNIYSQDKQQFIELLENGYSVKFITFNGLKNLLKMKFNKLEEQDYKIVDNTFELLELNPQQLSTLRQLLSINWTVEEHEREGLDTDSILVKLKPVVVSE